MPAPRANARETSAALVEMTRRAAFDDLIHPKPRLMICAALATAQEMRFDTLCQTLSMNPPALSKHLTKLSDAQYITMRADDGDSRRQWVSLTPAGRAAFAAHLLALQTLNTTPGKLEAAPSGGQSGEPVS